MSANQAALAAAGEPIRLPEPSRALRRPGMKSPTSVRGFLVARFPAEPHGRQIFFESALERNFLVLMLARPDVTDIVEQAVVVTYDVDDGRKARYTLDFLVTLRTGERIGVEVKPAARAREARVVERLSKVAAVLTPAHADRLCIFTDDRFQPWQATNASWLHEARKTADPEADAALSEALRSVHGTISVADLCEIVGLPCRGYAAILRAMDAQKLTLRKPGVIEPSSLIARGIA